LNDVIYIQSLHRPFNQNLNTVKWVCKFVSSLDNEIIRSEFYLDFYRYIFKFLNNEYCNIVINHHGLPSKESLSKVFNHLNGLPKDKFRSVVQASLKNRETILDKNIYTTYKASSYYINLAKDKFKLLREDYQLSNQGEKLLKFKSNAFILAGFKS